MKQFLIFLTAFCCFSCEHATNENQENKVVSVVKKMNKALATHDLDSLVACYSEDMDWENSFGWTIREKVMLKTYFGDWLFLRYPELDNARLRLKFKVDQINKTTAWVDVLQEIYSEDLSMVVRRYRQSHFLIHKNGTWLIKKSRLWFPTPNDDPPIAFLSSPSLFEK
ncbi:nuclear transport factor 2 family protein [Flagellimonas algicola]|uniref:Nuclear transport factor 2 family protein n=1 Tax=Flagellimonas algicola TaxID=2583815 RepID=A0ABY2WL39_9FLAO|nr:nuclear transport factor 2 family protein [Allomuricauda algicola]TMU55558.1 nuclear transport factor 2 family protein [Allomuricauda algicola]